MSGEEQAADKAAEEKKESGNGPSESESKPASNGPKQEAAASTSASTAPAATGGGEETLKLAAEDMVKRRSRWQSSMAAIRYVSSVSRDNEVKIRDTDRATSICLLIVVFVALLSLTVPILAAQRVPMVIAVDVLVGLSLLYYVANRLGIVTTFTPRQALLSWQLMLGSSLVGIYMAINLAVIIGLAVANTPPIVVPK